MKTSAKSWTSIASLSEEELQAEDGALEGVALSFEVQAGARRSGRGQAHSPGEEIAGAPANAYAAARDAGELNTAHASAAEMKQASRRVPAIEVRSMAEENQAEASTGREARRRACQTVVRLRLKLLQRPLKRSAAEAAGEPAPTRARRRRAPAAIASQKVGIVVFRQDAEDRRGSRRSSGAAPEVSSLRAAHVEVHGARRAGRDGRRQGAHRRDAATVGAKALARS